MANSRNFIVRINPKAAVAILSSCSSAWNSADDSLKMIDNPKVMDDSTVETDENNRDESMY